MVVKTLLETTGKKIASTYKPKKGTYTKQFEKTEDQSLKEKIGSWTNRQSAIAIEEMGKGVTMQFTKEGVPFVPAGTIPSNLTKAKGWAKVIAPIAAGKYLTRDKDEQEDKQSSDFSIIGSASADETNLLNDIYLPSLQRDEFENSTAFNVIKENGGDLNELATGEKAKQLLPPDEFNFSTYDEVENFKAQHLTKENVKMFAEGLIDFGLDAFKDSARTAALIPINGADFAVQFLPLIDKILDYSPSNLTIDKGGLKFNDLTNDDQVMEYAMNISNKLGEAREWVKDFKPTDNFVTELAGVIGQDMAYSIPIYNKLKKVLPNYAAVLISYGIGGAIGIEDEIFGNSSTFTQHYLESDVRKIKDFLGVLPNTTYDQIGDEVVQMFEYGALSWAIPQLIKSFQLMKKHIPAMAGGAAITTMSGDEASANPLKAIATKVATLPIFKSAVKASVEKLPNKGTGLQMFNTIKNNPGVKSSEMKWIGLDNFLTNNKTVTKTEIENFVKSNSIDVSEVKFAAGGTDQTAKYSDEIESMKKTFESKWLKANMSKDILRELDAGGNIAAHETNLLLNNNLNYDVYAISFGKAESQAVGRAETGTMDFNTLSQILGTEPSLNKMVKLKNGNLTAKYEIPEAIVKDRRDTFQLSPLEFEKYQVENAKRIHNEMLSEATGLSKFHAETQPGGENYTELVFKIKGDAVPVEVTSKNLAITKRKPLKFISKRHMNVENEIAHVRFKTRDLNGKKVLAVEEMQSDLAIASQKKKDAAALAGYMKDDKHVSDFPFKNTWYELTIKRLIRYAADNGFDAIAIPKSSIIKKRWQQTGGMADNIQVMELSDHYRIKFMNEDGITLLNKLYKKNAEGLNLLEKKIGESQMSKITEHYKDSKKLDVLTTDFKGKLDKKVYAGKGEGTTHLYDKVMPSFMRKYSKKWNAKVYDDSIETLKDFGQVPTPKEMPVTILEITPDMKKSVLEQGQPLFEFLGLATAGAATSKAVSDNIENNSISNTTN